MTTRIITDSNGRKHITNEPQLHNPQRQWVGLTDKERNQLWRDVVKWGDPSHDDVDLMKAIEDKLKERNT
jgi:hypothetical protein